MTVKNNAAISRVINQGGFGCIFYPSLPCKKETKRNSNSSSSEYVSKLVKKTSALKMKYALERLYRAFHFTACIMSPLYRAAPHL